MRELCNVAFFCITSAYLFLLIYSAYLLFLLSIIYEIRSRQWGTSTFWLNSLTAIWICCVWKTQFVNYVKEKVILQSSCVDLVSVHIYVFSPPIVLIFGYFFVVVLICFYVHLFCWFLPRFLVWFGFFSS